MEREVIVDFKVLSQNLIERERKSRKTYRLVGICTNMETRDLSCINQRRCDLGSDTRTIPLVFSVYVYWQLL